MEREVREDGARMRYRRRAEEGADRGERSFSREEQGQYRIQESSRSQLEKLERQELQETVEEGGLGRTFLLMGTLWHTRLEVAAVEVETVRQVGREPGMLEEEQVERADCRAQISTAEEGVEVEVKDLYPLRMSP